MTTRWSSVTIDCIDPHRVAGFWSALLGRPVGPSEPAWVYLGERGDELPRLVFQPVSEPKVGKTRIHLDVTEGVETEQTLTALAGFGCDVAQGYHLSRPISAAAFDEWCARPAPALLR